MAQPPYKIIDRRGSAVGYATSNKLIEAATQTTDRPAIAMMDFDVHRIVSGLGRRTLISLGKAMFWRFPALQGLVLEQANLAVSTFIPQYTGRNKDWGKLAEAALNEWHKVMDIAGWPYDYDSFLQNLVYAPIVEGETHTLLTENPDGYPMIQTIPTHRVGPRLVSNNVMVRVRFEGTDLYIDDVLVDSNRPYDVQGVIEFQARLMDGVIVDDYSRAIAYRVYEDNYTGAGTYTDIASRHFFPAFIPLLTGQVRGFSILASSTFDWQDMHQWKRWEMMAQMAHATRTLVEYNDSGSADGAKALIAAAPTDDAGNRTGLAIEKLEGGTIQYFKANSGQKLESFEYNRPGPDTQNFMKTTLRDAFRGTEWDMFFGLDPQAVGGAPMRVIVEKINAVLEKRRKLVRKVCRRVDGYALSKFMKLGLLPWDDDWYRWDYQGPGDVTADKKYDSDVALQEISQGIGTRKIECGRRGLDIDEVDAQREVEADSDLARAQKLSVKYGITIQEALAVLRPPASGTMPAVAQPKSNPNDQQQQQEDGKPAGDGGQ